MKLSIVTINYNDAQGIQKTLESVAQQSGTFASSSFELEHLIIDGGSNDQSVAIIKDYATAQRAEYDVQWLSEKDKGVYNAMNKGINMATGDYIQILNSGDVLASPTVIEECRLKIEELGWPELMYGNMIKRTPDGTVIGKSGEVPYSLLNYFTSTMNHDCCWIKRALFVNENMSRCYGLYDEDLKIVSDWKWFLQAIGLGHVRPVYVNIDMTIFDTTGISERNLALRNEERRKVLEEVLPPAILADYDKHAFDMHQMDNLRKHPWAYKFVWTLERILNRLDNRNFKKPKK